MTTRRIVIDTVPSSDLFRLDDEHRHYLGRVLRLSSGATLEIVDTEGAVWTGILEFSSEEAVVRQVRRLKSSDHDPECVLVASLLKQTRWQVVLEKSAELGATSILPIKAERSVVRVSPSKVEAKRARWQRICDAAVRQSERMGRTWVAHPSDLHEATGAMRERGCTMLFGDETNPEEPWPQLSSTTPVALFVGPEGGFTPEERAHLIDAGAAPVGLGPSILRAETASIVGLTAIRMIRAGLLP